MRVNLASRFPVVGMPTMVTVVAGTALGWALFGVTLFRNDGDVGRHVRVGRHILDTGTIPKVDLFSHTMAGEPFVPYEWLSEVAFAAVDRLAGLAGVAALTGMLFAAACVVVFRFGRLTGAGPILAGAVASLSMVLQAVHLLPRPHLFTTLFAVTLLLLMETWRRQPRWLLLVISMPFMALWTNLHGGFLVGFVILGVYLMDAWRPGSRTHEQRLYVLLTIIGCFLATFLNPVGPAIWPHTLSYFGLDFLVDQTNEYQSPDFHQLYGKLFLIAIVLGFLMLGSGRARSGFRDLMFFLGWLSAGLMSARNIPLFGVLAVPWFASWASSVLEASAGADEGWWSKVAEKVLGLDRRMAITEEGVGGMTPTIVIVLGLTVYAVTHGRERYEFDATSFPVAATEALRDLDLEGNVFNEMPWGGYLLYHRPDIPVFIDGQTDFYGEDLAKDYLRIRQLSPRALDLLESYEIDWIFIPRTIPLPQALALDPRWQLTYQDEVALIFKRSETPS
jgi:hypothetical protein